jgi:hypothetical protein
VTVQLRLFIDERLAVGSFWRGRRGSIIEDYYFEVLPVIEWYGDVGVRVFGPGWPYGGGKSHLAESDFGLMVVPASERAAAELRARQHTRAA